MNNRKLAFIWIAVVIVMLFFGWLIVRAGEPVNDTVPARKPMNDTVPVVKKKQQNKERIINIERRMSEQNTALDSILMKKREINNPENDTTSN